MTYLRQLSASKRLTLSFTSIVLFSLFALGASAVQTFGAWSLSGTYAFTFDGTALFPDGAGGVIPTPVAATGWFRSDGKGNIPETVRILNVGGDVFHQVASGTYEIDEHGLGTSEFEVFDADTGVKVSEESFIFVLDDNTREIRSIATGFKSFLLDPGGVDVGVIVRIEARRQ